MKFAINTRSPNRTSEQHGLAMRFKLWRQLRESSREPRVRVASPDCHFQRRILLYRFDSEKGLYFVPSVSCAYCNIGNHSGCSEIFFSRRALVGSVCACTCRWSIAVVPSRKMLHQLRQQTTRFASEKSFACDRGKHALCRTYYFGEKPIKCSCTCHI